MTALPLCYFYGCRPDFEGIDRRGGILCCGFCGKPMTSDEIKVGMLEREMLKPKHELVQTRVHPLLGRSFLVHENYHPTRRERLFGRGRKLRGETFRHG